MPANSKIIVPLITDGCVRTVNHVKYLEHVQARITLCGIRRGEISIYLKSPMGTRSTLLARRQRDISRDGFNNWAFMTTHNWGEYAKGTWTLEIENGGSASKLHCSILVCFYFVLFSVSSEFSEWPCKRPKINEKIRSCYICILRVVARRALFLCGDFCFISVRFDLLI